MPSHSHTSSHPYGPYGPCSYYTRVLYYVAPCKPLRPDPSLPGMDQRGVAQEKWPCGQPRPYQAYGLCMLVLPVGRSGHRPSSHDDVIGGSTWKHPKRTYFRIADVIGMLMVGVAPSYVIGMAYSNHYSDPYVIGIWYGGSTVYPVPLWY